MVHAHSQLLYLPPMFQHLLTLLLPSLTLRGTFPPPQCSHKFWSSQISPQNGSDGNTSHFCRTMNTSYSDQHPVSSHFRGCPEFGLPPLSYMGPRVHTTFPCCPCIRFFGSDCHLFRQWEHTPNKHPLMLKPAAQGTCMTVPWHSLILFFFSWPCVSS